MHRVLTRKSAAYFALFFLGACGLLSARHGDAPSDPAEASASIKRASEPSPGLDEPARPLRLATWNLEWLNADEDRGPVPRTARDYDAFARYATQLDADVVAVQEVDGAKALDRVFDPNRFQAILSHAGGTQNVGFAVRRDLLVERYPDVESLDVGGLRSGVDIGVSSDAGQLRLLSVHLKSGCFFGRLDTGKSCAKFSAQLAPLEAWIDARQLEGETFVVLGDFNRQFFSQPDEPVWAELNDGSPDGLTLWSPTAGRQSDCGHGRFPAFIDHIVLSAGARSLVVEGSFEQLIYSTGDQAVRLSDHCPIALSLAIRPSRTATVDAHSAPSAPPIGAAPIPDRHEAPGPIKGNLSKHGRRIYHLPHCPDYAVTKIDPSRGERWFVSEKEAVSAGFVKARNCPQPRR